MKDGESTVLKRGDHSTHGICTTTTRSGNQGHTHAPTLRRDGESHTRTSRFSLRGPFKNWLSLVCGSLGSEVQGRSIDLYFLISSESDTPYHLFSPHCVCDHTTGQRVGGGDGGVTAAAQRRRGWRRGGRGRRRGRAHDEGPASGEGRRGLKRAIAPGRRAGRGRECRRVRRRRGGLYRRRRGGRGRGR